MSLTDLLIIYLAFGAPLAVYKYLQNRRIDLRRRIVVSGLTFFFWIPAAVEIAYLYLTNAYYIDHFVSRRDLDSADVRLRELRESITSQLVRVTRGVNLHDVHEAVDRYVGLADSARGEMGPSRSELFEAAGRENNGLSSRCLMRRNLRRLQRHHIQARRDFVDLFRQMPNGTPVTPALNSALELARQLDDDETVQQLTSLAITKGEIWNSEQQHQAQLIATVSPIAMTASLNND